MKIMWCFVADKETVRDSTHSNGDQQLGEEEQKFGDFVQCDNTQRISHQQIECVSRTRAKWFAMDSAHDVSVFAEESKEGFQAPEEAFHAAQYTFRDVVVVFFKFLIDVLQTDTNHTTY